MLESVSDPDWIQSGQWILIRIRNPDPDPEGQKLSTKVEKLRNFMFGSERYSLLRADGIFCNLDVLYGGLVISKLYF
jgi:hypothetical protein